MSTDAPLTIPELEALAALCLHSAYGPAAIRESDLRRLIAQAPTMARRVEELDTQAASHQAWRANALRRIEQLEHDLNAAISVLADNDLTLHDLIVTPMKRLERIAELEAENAALHAQLAAYQEHVGDAAHLERVAQRQPGRE